jgi:hypothetical protein
MDAPVKVANPPDKTLQIKSNITMFDAPKQPVNINNLMDAMRDDMSVDDSFSDDSFKNEKSESFHPDESDTNSPTKMLPDSSNSKLANKKYQTHTDIITSTADIQLDRRYTTFDNLMSENKLSKHISTDLAYKRSYDPNSEIKKLKDQLFMYNKEIERLKDAKQISVEAPESAYHLAFMFASPLVRKMNNNLENIMKLDYKNEIAGVEKILKNVQHEIKYKVEVATISNFRSVIADAPIALHFTGHGIQNNRQSLGGVYELYKDKGNILLLEDENCMAEYLFENDLKKLVELSKANREFTYNYEVVFVSSCHSEFAGNIFHVSGAHHVICIQKSDTILDKASLRFSKVFYETLFVKKYSV